MPRDEAGGVIPCEECVEAAAHLRRLAALEVLIGAGRQEVMVLVAENARLREALKNITGAIETSPWIDAYQLAGGRYEGLQAIAHLALRREALGEGGGGE